MDSDSSATPPATIKTAATGCRDGEHPYIQTHRPERDTTQPDGENHGDTHSFTRSFVSDQREHVRAPFQNQQRIPNVKLNLFDGQNISRFLKRFEMEFRSRGHPEETMAEYLPMYCKLEWFTMIEDMPGYKTRDWSLLKQSMRDAFCDEEKHKYSLASLRKFVAKLKQRGKPDKLSKVSRVYFKFTGISSYLKDKKIIGVQEESRYFLSILPEEIVDMIHSRRDTRRLVTTGGNDVDDDECALPAIADIIKEVRGIYANYARRGKISKIRSRREPDSDTDSDSELSEDSPESDSSDEDDIYCKPKRSRSHSARSSSKRGKSSKTSDSDRGYEKTKTPTKRKEEPKAKEDPMKDLLLKFSELQVTVAQLATQAQAGGNGGNQGAPYVRRNSFGNGTRPPMPPQNQNPNAGRWNAPRRDAPPHESNAAAYETTYYSNYAGTGANAVPNNQAPTNQWGNRPPAAQNGNQGPTNGNFGSAAGPSYSVNGPFTPNGGPYAPRPPPLCLWCAGEDGDPHWMYGCADLTKAIKDGLVRRDPEGKIRYNARYIPGRGHPRGMRAWVREQEDLLREPNREANNERNPERVRFGKEVQMNSVEYDPPEIEDHTDYESGNVRVDEYEVNQTKRPRSGTSADIPPPKIRTPRTYRPQENLFEDLGVPRAAKPVEKKDVEMKDSTKQRATSSAPRPKLESAIESKSDPRAFLDKILQQPITIPMSIMLANSPELAKMMVAECRRKRTPLGDNEANYLGWEDGDEDTPQVNLNSYEGSKKSYYAGVLAFANITVEGEIIKALLDNGSMICMMQDEVRKRLGLPIRTDGSHRVRMAGGGLETLLGISENVPVRIGGVTTYVHFFISKGSSNPILLGQNFLRQVEARFSYHADGSVMMGMTFKGKRITVEVTSKDESRYLSQVPGETRDYDSAMVTMVGQINEDRRMGPFCAWCVPTHQIYDHPNGQGVCTGQHTHPARISKPRNVQETSSAGNAMNGYTTRNTNRTHDLRRTDAFRNFTPTQFGNSVPDGIAPWETVGAPQSYGEASQTKRQRSKKNGSRKPDFNASNTVATTPNQPKISPRWSDQMEVDAIPTDSGVSVTIRPLNNVQPDVFESMGIHRGITVRIQHTESTEVLEKRQQQMIAEAAEQAIEHGRLRHEELRKQLGEKTSPWILTCTAEEAATRAQELRDEYDHFLEVLFGRRIRLEKKPKIDWSEEEEIPETETIITETDHQDPDAKPKCEYPPSAPRKEKECGSMMFPTRTLRKYRSIDMALYTHEYRTIATEDEPNNIADSTTGAASETAFFEMDDWINNVVAKEVEGEETGDPDEAYKRLCAEKVDSGEPATNQKSNSVEQEESLMITELGLLPNSTIISPGEMSSEELITELGTRIEGCVFTANLVELVNPEESFNIEEDWPAPEDDDDSEPTEFMMDDDFYYSLVEGVGNLHFLSEDDTSRTDEDEAESTAAYERPEKELTDDPIFIEGKWRTFELDSNMSEDEEESEGSRIISRMIQNSKERRERLIKVTQSQIDARCAREFELSQSLGKKNNGSGGSNSTYSANSVELKTEDVEMRDVTPEPPTIRHLTAQEIRKGYDRRIVLTDTETSKETPKFKTQLEPYRLSSSSGNDEWAKPSMDQKRPKIRHESRKKDTAPKSDQRTLRELREDLNSMLFDVSSVNLRSQSTKSGKGTPLVNN
ncbi:hypothetical protein P7C70_g4775, partial [Phenoliferia sp. Uapishka_3]